ncbi:MAG: zonular occludens toxin domain-containing protein [Planctomycetaceae bacterium]|nr:zonular occludens toxin domain-containing protein [Planctomycetaceae bacterium]
MSLQIVAGKPGSGKSYHTVTMLLQHLEDWALYERKEGQVFDRALYTNLPLQTDFINEYLTKKTGDETDVSHYIKPIDEDVRKRFIQCGGKFPLAVLPQNAMIVIDEVQKLFGSEMDTDKKHKQFNIEFRNYVSQHRHYGHDLIFITQHTDNISKQILAMAEKLYQVENAKHYGLPFPLNIPLADLDVVKEAFGVKSQFYRVSVGKYQGRRVKFDGETTSHLMLQEIFACYSSHTLSDVTSDRPSLKLSKPGALLWLAKKHAWHLSLKALIAVFVSYWGINIISQFPTILTKTLMASFKPASETTFPAPEGSDNVTTPDMSLPCPAPMPSAASDFGLPASGESIETNPEVPSHKPEVCDCCTHDHSLPPLKPNEKITAVFQLGVITDNGRRRIGQPVSIDGTEETIKAVNVRRGVVIFESGKEVSVPK